MNPLISTISTYKSKEISDKVANDPSIVNLSIGEPFFSPPKLLYERLQSYLFNESQTFSHIPNRYADSKGELMLREEIAKRYYQLYKATIDPRENILITHGACGAIWLAVVTLTAIGDEIIIPDPSYLLYEIAGTLLGRVPVKVPTRAENGFCLDIRDIENAITSKTRMILINSPENPTGAVYDHQLIKEIHSLAQRHDLYFAHDEVYDGFVFNGTHENIFRHESHIDDNSILINGFSKKFSMMGWRLGWLIGSANVISNAVKVHTNMTLNLGSFHQQAAASILNDPSIDGYLEGNLASVINNVAILRVSLTETPGFQLQNGIPKGGLFLFPEVSGLYDSLPDPYKRLQTKGESVAEFLLNECRIAVVPGIVYGSTGADHIRIVASVEERIAKEAAKRFSSIMKPEAIASH